MATTTARAVWETGALSDAVSSQNGNATILFNVSNFWVIAQHWVRSCGLFLCEKMSMRATQYEQSIVRKMTSTLYLSLYRDKLFSQVISLLPFKKNSWQEPPCPPPCRISQRGHCRSLHRQSPRWGDRRNLRSLQLRGSWPKNRSLPSPMAWNPNNSILRGWLVCADFPAQGVVSVQTYWKAICSICSAKNRMHNLPFQLLCLSLRYELPPVQRHNLSSLHFLVQKKAMSGIWNFGPSNWNFWQSNAFWKFFRIACIRKELDSASFRHIYLTLGRKAWRRTADAHGVDGWCPEHCFSVHCRKRKLSDKSKKNQHRVNSTFRRFRAVWSFWFGFRDLNSIL